MIGARETELVFINGHDHIGGLQVALRTPGAELFFDLGLAQTERAALFNAAVPMHEGRDTLTDYLRSGMAPLIENFYSPVSLAGDFSHVIEPLGGPGRVLARAPLFPDSGVPRAVFISHLHSDHAGLLRFLNSAQTVYMSKVGKRIYDAMVAASAILATEARIVGLHHSETVILGDLELTLLETDHDIPGAAGFVARTVDGSVAYTGDWRYHGLNPEHMDRFAAECAARGVDILITEASTAVPNGFPRWPWGGGIPREIVGGQLAASRPLTERQACTALADEIARADGLIFVCLHQQHFERVEALAASAEATGRRMVVTGRTASLWAEAADAGLLDVERRLILVLDDDDHPHHGCDVVSREQVALDRDAFIIQLAQTTYRELLTLGAGPADLLIHANGHPLGSQYPGWESLITWITHLGIPLVVIDSHGHVEPDALMRFTEATEARVVIPVHSDHPSEAAVPQQLKYLPHRWERLRLAETKNGAPFEHADRHTRASN